VSEWRPVIKGRVRPKGHVLVFANGVTAADKLDAAIFGGSPQASSQITIARWSRGAWREHIRGWIIRDVTHWMPLPDSPGPEQQQNGKGETPGETVRAESS